MSELARANGWRGFEGIGERTAGGYEYMCDGMPSPMGCGASIVVPRRFARVGIKKTGWFVCYGLNEDSTPDLDVVLTFCPRCTQVVLTTYEPREWESVMGGPRLSIENKRQIEELTRDGHSARSIAAVVGCTSRTVERWQAQSGVRSTWEPVRAPCGTDSAYQRGCRCEACTKAHARNWRERWQRKHHSTESETSP